jgi:short-subunit dehydrogenase
MNARTVAEAGLRAMLAGRRMVVPGWKNRVLLFLERFAPRGAVISAVKKMMQKRIGETRP